MVGVVESASYKYNVRLPTIGPQIVQPFPGPCHGWRFIAPGCPLFIRYSERLDSIAQFMSFSFVSKWGCPILTVTHANI